MTQHKTAFANILCLLLFTQTAAAFDVSKMTENQRAAFRAEIRAYLLDNPEVIYEAVDILQQRQAQTETQRDLELVENNSAAIFADGYSYVGGNTEGDITLVEFVDYKCGYCRKAHSEVEELLARDGNIKLIIKEFPILGESSITSAQFANAIHRQLPEINKDIEKGNFKNLIDWLRINIHEKASFFSTNNVLEQVTNSSLNAKYFKQYVTNRYL